MLDVPNFIWVGFYPIVDGIQTFILDSIYDETLSPPTKEDFVLVDSPVGSFEFVGGVSASVIL